MELDSEIKEENLDRITVADATANQDMVKDINYLIAEGFIELEEDENGDIRAYPAGK